MSSPFNQQLTKWWSLVSAKSTWDAFKNFFELTWIILKETGILAYLFILGGLVSIGWVVDRSSELTDSIKTLQTQANQKQDQNLLSVAGQSLWQATKTTTDKALTTARNTLKIETPPKKDKPATPPTATKPASPPAETEPDPTDVTGEEKPGKGENWPPKDESDILE